MTKIYFFLAICLMGLSFMVGFNSKETIPNYIQAELKNHDFDPNNFEKKDWDLYLAKLEKSHINHFDSLISDKGKNLMHLAAQNGSQQSILKLLELGYDINEKDKFGNTPIFYAILNSVDVDFLIFMTNHGANLHIYKTELKKDDALSFALKIEDKRNLRDNKRMLVDFLKDNGFEYKKKHFRYLRENNGEYLYEFVKTLGINELFFKKNNLGYFEYIVAKAEDETIEYMLENKVDMKTYVRKQDLLQNALTNSKISLFTLDKLLKKGIDINIQNNEGNTPLMVAIKRGTIDQVRFLLENGASVTMTNHHDENAFDFVKGSIKSEKRRDELFALLRSYRK